MSAASNTLRHTANTAEEKALWASIKDDSIAFLKGDSTPDNDLIAFLKGDSTSPWAILAETVIGCVPVLGQLVDARDIIKGLAEVGGAPTSPMAWFNLITAIIGIVPGGGDAVKGSARAIKSGAMHTEDLLPLIRKVYKGDPEKLLTEMLDVGKLRSKLDEILTNPTLTKHLSAEAQQSINRIRRDLNKQFDLFKQEVESWLKKGRKTSAEAGPAAKPKTSTPATTPSSKKGTGSQSKADHSDAANANANNPAKQRQQRFKSLEQKVLGILGEHMADYYCQDVKGWGEKSVHDRGGINPAKLNDGGQLVQLWPIRVRGRGIDAVWKTNNTTRPYAIIEAKASYDLTKGLNALLGQAGDKTEKNISDGGNFQRKKKSAAGRGSSKDDVRQTNGKVTQMSHGWIRARLKRVKLTDKFALGDLQARLSKAYTRHVLFFSIPHAASHAEALILYTAQQYADQSMHATHQATREWGDNEIERVVNTRADKYTAERAEKSEKRKWKK